MRYLTPAWCLLWVYWSDGGKFWHISDLHLDYNYEAGGDTTNMCHRFDSDKSDMGVGPAGNYSCDSPLLLVESALQAMQRHHPTPDFIVWTGDSAPHWRYPQPPDQNYITNVTNFVFSKLDAMFPGITVVPALGNHDASPPDQFPISGGISQPDYYQNLWSKGAFGNHINTSHAKDTFLQCGFFSKTVKLADGLVMTFLVLNTNIYYHDNFTTAGDRDPCGQLSWLDKSLKNSDENGKVFIVAHVPPGSFERSAGELNFNTPSETWKDINKRYIEIVSRPDNSRKISAHLYGHLHTDTFRIFLDRGTRTTPVGVAFMAASVTPVLWVNNQVVGVNPTIRLLEYNKEGILLDYSTYYLDLRNPFTQRETISDEEAKGKRINAKYLNITKSRAARETKREKSLETIYDIYWKHLYSARETYKLDNISASSMFQAFKRMVLGEGDSFSQYYKYNTALNDGGKCNQSCVQSHLCTISNLVLTELTNCLENNDPRIYDYYFGVSQTEEEITKTKSSSRETVRQPFIMGITANATSKNAHNENDHSHDRSEDHEQPQNSTNEADMTVEKFENYSTNSVSIFFGILVIALVILFVLFGYKKYRINRERNQEFLLTDSVFRYDGYSHLEYE